MKNPIARSRVPETVRNAAGRIRHAAVNRNTPDHTDEEAEGIRATVAKAEELMVELSYLLTHSRTHIAERISRLTREGADPKIINQATRQLHFIERRAKNGDEAKSALADAITEVTAHVPAEAGKKSILPHAVAAEAKRPRGFIERLISETPDMPELAQKHLRAATKLTQTIGRYVSDNERLSGEAKALLQKLRNG